MDIKILDNLLAEPNTVEAINEILKVLATKNLSIGEAKMVLETSKRCLDLSQLSSPPTMVGLGSDSIYENLNSRRIPSHIARILLQGASNDL